MSDIYGQITEHPEYSIVDPRRWTVTIKAHDFERVAQRRGRNAPPDPFCARCGYHEDTEIHPQARA